MEVLDSLGMTRAVRDWRVILGCREGRDRRVLQAREVSTRQILVRRVLQVNRGHLGRRGRTGRGLTARRGLAARRALLVSPVTQVPLALPVRGLVRSRPALLAFPVSLCLALLGLRDSLDLKGRPDPMATSARMARLVLQGMRVKSVRLVLRVVTRRKLRLWRRRVSSWA